MGCGKEGCFRRWNPGAAGVELGPERYGDVQIKKGDKITMEDIIAERYSGEKVDKIIAAEDSARRKASPVFSGVMAYFPDALMAVARVSKAGNDKHNPGQPLHWSRGKSNDHLDCAARHLLTPYEVDPEIGELHIALVAWRALAALQIYLEEHHASH